MNHGEAQDEEGVGDGHVVRDADLDRLLDGVDRAGRGDRGGADSGDGEYRDPGGHVTGECFGCGFADGAECGGAGGSGFAINAVVDRAISEGGYRGTTGIAQPDTGGSDCGAVDTEWTAAGATYKGCDNRRKDYGSGGDIAGGGAVGRGDCAAGEWRDGTGTCGDKSGDG